MENCLTIDRSKMTPKFWTYLLLYYVLVKGSRPINLSRQIYPWITWRRNAGAKTHRLIIRHRQKDAGASLQEASRSAAADDKTGHGICSLRTSYHGLASYVPSAS